MEAKKFDNKYVIRLEHGEKVMETLLNFMKKENIGGAFFYGLGALTEVDLAYYVFDTKEYHRKIFKGEFEVNNLSGNVTLVDKNPFIHLHISLADHEYKGFGGHVFEATCGPTLEICLEVFPEPIHRKESCEAGLKFMNLEKQ